MAEMADAEHLASELAEPGAERHVERFENDLAQPVGIEPVGNKDRSQRIRMLAGIGAKHLEPPAGDGAPRRLGMSGVAVKHRREALLVEQHPQGLAYPNKRLVAGVYGKNPVRPVSSIASQSQ